MDRGQILDELLGLLEKEGVLIRKDSLGGGGLCKVKGERIFYFDVDSGFSEQCAKCVEAILSEVDVDSIYIRPAVREVIEKYGRNHNIQS